MRFWPLDDPNLKLNKSMQFDKGDLMKPLTTPTPIAGAFFTRTILLAHLALTMIGLATNGLAATQTLVATCDIRTDWVGTNHTTIASNVVHSSVVTVGANEIARVLHFASTYKEPGFPGPDRPFTEANCHFELEVQMGTNSIRYDHLSMFGGGSTAGEPRMESGLPVIVGPATLQVIWEEAAECDGIGSKRNGVAICTVEVVSREPTTTPTGAVVIPADSAGPVEIVLESSADLITWTTAQPGIYGSTAERRFFRVRAVNR